MIEVRSRDASGELTLATLIGYFDQIPVEGAFRDSPEPAFEIARVRWNTDPGALLRATRIEAVRGETQAIDLSLQQTTLLLSLPVYGEHRNAYSRSH